MIAAMYFANPAWLWVTAGVLAVFAALLWHSSRARGRQLAAFADPAQSRALLASHSRVRRVAKNTLLFFAALVSGLALARPQWGVVEEQTLRAKGEDVVFVLDLSKSMLAADVKPNRLERAKLAILGYLGGQKGGRMGLVVFAGNAFLRVPLTLDYAAFEESVMSTSPEDLHVPGTDLGTALAVAKGAFEKTDKRRVLVLLTDGEDLEKLGVKYAEEFAKDGIVVFTVGMGTATGAAVQTLLPNGASVPMLDAQGQPVISRLDEATLRGIADATGGTYRRMDRISDAMMDVERAMRATELTPGGGVVKRRGVDRYPWFVAVAILLLVVDSFLTTRRRIPHEP